MAADPSPPAAPPQPPGGTLRAEGVIKAYGPPTARVEALRGVDLEIAAGERVALLGKSGSGKSTLLNLLAGLDRPTAGAIHVAGRDLARLTAGELADYRLYTVGMVFQGFNLIHGRTALQNVELPLVFAGRAVAERRATARAALAAVGLGARLSHYPAELSGGEQQRVAIARALINRPAVLLADEPTGNLDSATAAEILELLLGHLRQHGTTLILVTHDEEVGRRATDRVIRLHDGRVVA